MSIFISLTDITVLSYVPLPIVFIRHSRVGGNPEMFSVLLINIFNNKQKMVRGGPKFERLSTSSFLNPAKKCNVSNGNQ